MSNLPPPGQPAPQAPPIQPQPVPVTINTARIAAPDGSPFVVLEVLSFTGAAVYFLPAEFARQVARNILKQASGLEVPDMAAMPLLGGRG